jgi:hypothetical protein
VVSANGRVHQTRDLFIVSGILVVMHTLYQGIRAVANANDGNTYLSVILFTRHEKTTPKNVIRADATADC